MKHSMQGSPLPISVAGMSDLLATIYRAAVNEPTAKSFIKSCCGHIDAIAGVIAISDARNLNWGYLDLYPDMPITAADYQANFAPVDPVNKALFKAAPGRFHARQQLLTEEEIASDPYVVHWRSQLDFGEFCGARIEIANQYNCMVSFVRRVGQPAFSRRELDLLDMLLPHIQHAVTIHNKFDRLSIFADIAQEQLLQTGHGLLLLNSDRRVTYLNRVAARMSREGALFTIGPEKSILLPDAQAQDQFDALVRVCTQVSRSRGILAGGSFSVARPGGSPLVVTVLPYRREEGLTTFRAEVGRAVVTIFDPEEPRFDSRVVLQDLYGFSPAEAEVCWRIANGETPNDIAVNMGSTRETVRSRLKRVFAKTGTKRQPDLVRLVLLGPAAWGRIL